MSPFCELSSDPVYFVLYVSDALGVRPSTRLENGRARSRLVERESFELLELLTASELE
jgi:hypothetical protein